MKTTLSLDSKQEKVTLQRGKSGNQVIAPDILKHRGSRQKTQDAGVEAKIKTNQISFGQVMLAWKVKISLLYYPITSQGIQKMIGLIAKGRTRGYLNDT